MTRSLRLQKSRRSLQVLSEGEQRALGMAMFLAELESLPHASTVIFDDPSASLDHVSSGHSSAFGSAG
ncbi:hypothetical protein [Klebsiella pneumoniae]|uniref:hypothetical protein n=1 Tax=Klebsiella pneumoniae TaxID=573 RepID=UPI002970023A|nr:hypothetical protein [Klebsiella pneumoniae]